MKPQSVNGSIKSDPTGSYDPDVEVFSLKAKHVVRQVRRLKSFRRSLKVYAACTDFSKSTRMRRQLLQEWFVIRKARGFGSRWSAWILSYEDVAFISLDLPTFEAVDLYVDITEMYANLVCRHEARARYHSFRQRIKVDQEHGFLSLSYKIVRMNTSPILTEVPFEVQRSAVLLRARKGSMALKINDNAPFVVNSAAMFEGHPIVIVKCDGLKVYFTSQSEKLPAEGSLVQKGIAMTVSQIQGAFNDFWSQYWNRDSVHSTSDCSEWSSFLDEIHLSNFPRFDPVEVKLDDLKEWKAASPPS